ncbi:hypothetical protein EG328_002524 [Venturia inaequalis]|uniref:Uncharacterized protein n=1 Tax=Venturia inaequalis TaxID=5025 RepID=A0A8H3UWG3_VENIN|nr:hypothetical protein EG328_002524 [Venturia inaequalis]
MTPNTNDTFAEIIALINEGRKHFAEQGTITRGTHFPNGLSHPGTRNAGTRSRYYRSFYREAVVGYVSGAKEGKILPKPGAVSRTAAVSRSVYRGSPSGQRESSGGMGGVEELYHGREQISARAVQMWDSILEGSGRNGEREMGLVTEQAVEEEKEKENNRGIDAMGAGFGMQRSEETRERGSEEEGEEDVMDLDGDGDLAGKRGAFGRAFGYRGRGGSS